MRDDMVLHIHLGMAIWFAGVLVVRDPASPWPLLAVTGIECANEGFDRLRTGSWNWAETRADLIATLLWPTLLFAAARVSGC